MAEEFNPNEAPDSGEKNQKLTKEEKKAQKKREKEEKKLARKKAKEDGTDNEEEEEKASSKIGLVVVTILIILIWLGIIALLIKTDVGGFGSSVLSPVLKNVPYINRILPDTGDSVNQDSQTTEEDYPYDSLNDAVARIKELEKQLDDANAAKQQDDTTIADLQSQVDNLSQYQENEAAFEQEKEKFYEEVVFSDNAPDISNYKQYYESIDPANAEVLYKQVVEQLTYDSEVEDYAKTYSSMKPKEAAAIFDTMTDNLDLVANILQAMDTQSRANILGKMSSATAAEVTKLLEPEQQQN